MSAKRWNFSLPNSPFVNRKSLFVLMKASGSLGDGADSQTKQHLRTRLSVALEVSVQSSFTLRFRHAIVRQRKVVHSDLDIIRTGQHLASQFVERPVLTGPRQIFILVTALRRLDPRYARKAVERDAIGTQLNRLLNCRRKTLGVLARQSIDQIVIDRGVTEFAR